MINDARTFFQIDQMFLGAAVIGIIGYTVNWLLKRLEQALLPYRKETLEVA